eukprot:586808_1
MSELPVISMTEARTLEPNSPVFNTNIVVEDAPSFYEPSSSIEEWSKVTMESYLRSVGLTCTGNKRELSLRIQDNNLEELLYQYSSNFCATSCSTESSGSRSPSVSPFPPSIERYPPMA